MLLHAFDVLSYKLGSAEMKTHTHTHTLISQIPEKKELNTKR